MVFRFSKTGLTGFLIFKKRFYWFAKFSKPVWFSDFPKQVSLVYLFSKTGLTGFWILQNQLTGFLPWGGDSIYKRGRDALREF